MIYVTSVLQSNKLEKHKVKQNLFFLTAGIPKALNMPVYCDMQKECLQYSSFPNVCEYRILYIFKKTLVWNTLWEILLLGFTFKYDVVPGLERW